MKIRWIRTILISGLIPYMVVACGNPSQQSDKPTSLQEAYTLMDNGQNAKAILLLEKVTQHDPASEEARVLLASACLGEAGVDVYKIHESFKDVLFAQSFSDSFWSGKLNSDSTLSSDDDAMTEPRITTPKTAPLEKLLDRLDVTLIRLRKVITFLNRFPNVQKRDWSLLDKALENLDSITQTRDVSLYKVFVRVIYLKAYLGQEVVSDPDFGRKQWACSLDLEKLRENLIWVTQNLVAASEDFRRVFPDKVSSLDGIHGDLAGLLNVLEEMRSNAPVGSNTGLLGAQQRLRDTFKCADTLSSSQ